MKKLLILGLSMLVLSCSKKTNLSDLYKDKNFYTHVEVKEGTDTITGLSLRLNSDNSEKVIMRLFYLVKPDTIKKINFDKTKKSGKIVEDTKIIQGWKMSCYQIGLVPSEYEKTAKPFTLLIDDVKYEFVGKVDESIDMVFYHNTILSDDDVFVDKLRNAKSIFVEYGDKKDNLISLKSDATKLYNKYKELKDGIFVKDTKIAFDVESDVVKYEGMPVKFSNSKKGLAKEVIEALVVNTCYESKRVCSHPLTFKPKDCNIYGDGDIITVSLYFEAANSFNVAGTLHTYAKYKDLKLIEVSTF